MDMAKHYEWSTHQPIIRMIVKEFMPKFMLELGCGMFSTPILFESKESEILCVENDEAWIDHLRKELHFPKNAKIRFHDLQGVEKHTKFSSLRASQKTRLFEDYLQLGSTFLNKETPRFLFVDQYTCARNISINMLGEHFDFIAYHDCQPEGQKVYEYKFTNYLRNNYTHYYLKTPTSWTGLFIKEEHNKGEVMMQALIAPYIEQYCKENGLPVDKVTFVKANEKHS